MIEGIIVDTIFALIKFQAIENKILNGDYMNRFLDWFYECETSELVNRINEYAKKA